MKLITLVAFCVAIASIQSGIRSTGFLAPCGTILVRDGKPFRNVGANMPDLFERFLHGEDGPAADSLARARQVGIRFVRCFGGTWGSGEFGIFETDRPRWIAAFDRMLAAASDQGIAVVPSLLFNANMIPEYVRKKSGRDEQIVDYLTEGTGSNRLAVEYVRCIVSRYRNDPRILFWEIGNEYNLEADLSARWKERPANQIPTSDHVRAFLIQIATLIKQIDHNHLVTSGNSDMRPYAWHIRQAMLSHKSKQTFDYPMDWSKDSFEQYVEMLNFFNPPPLDIISVHHYPAGKENAAWLGQDDSAAAMIAWTRKASDLIGRPLYIGEFAEVIFKDGREQPSLWTHDFLRQIRAGTASIASFWTWEYRSDDSGQEQYCLRADHAPLLIDAFRRTNSAIFDVPAEKRFMYLRIW